jgi:hypothetical protein
MNISAFETKKEGAKSDYSVFQTEKGQDMKYLGWLKIRTDKNGKKYLSGMINVGSESTYTSGGSRPREETKTEKKEAKKVKRDHLF